MRGIILAGGLGSRLKPLTNCINKHLLPVGDKPMLYHSIEKFVNAGIKDIMIITGPEHSGGIFQTLGDGSEFNCSFTFRVQSKPGGIAEALLLCEDFVGEDNCCVILGDNIFDAEGHFEKWVKDFEEDEGAKIVLCQPENLKDLSKFGVASLFRSELTESFEYVKITDIVEKPQKEFGRNDFAVTGIYFYDNKVFGVIRNWCKYSDRGELEISDVNKAYLKSGKLSYEILRGWWTDAGTLESYAKANELVRKQK